MNIPRLMAIADPVGSPFPNEISKWLALALCFVVALVAPKLGAKKLQHLEGAISRFAVHRRQAVLFCAVLPVLARVALLPIFG
ncbi:MAG: hypothetical protein JO307_31760, partial [Bryobacterales bacterium]|nr:hypothetical protein [Bryobacterales bacterium]